MNGEQIRSLLIGYINSEHHKIWHPKRQQSYIYNHNWIDPEKIKKMQYPSLKSEFLKYFGGGEGRQVLNQIWRDRIIRDEDKSKPKFRDVLLYLLNEKLSIEERFTNVVSSNGNNHINGIGKGLASAFLMDFDAEKYCIWNNKTEMGFRTLDWELPYESNDEYGVKYSKVINQLKVLRDDIGSGLNLNFDDVDNFLHWVAAEDEGKIAVKNILGAEALPEIGVYLDAPEEKFVQKFIEKNFDAVFSDLNLKLYEDNPDQNGFQYTTPVGRLDFLTIDAMNGDYVVVELKVGKVHDSALGQIQRYMGYVKEELAGEKNVRGILLGEELPDKTRYALMMAPSVEFKKYRLNIKIN